MIPEHCVSTHPGEFLSEDFLKPAGVSQAAFARHIGVEPAVISEIVHGRRGVSPEMALKFAAALGGSPDFWSRLQMMHDLTVARERLRRERRLQGISVMPEFAAASKRDVLKEPETEPALS